MAGRAPAVVHTFQTIHHDLAPPLPALAAARATGAVPMLTWVPRDVLGPVALGEYDAVIRGYGQALASLTYPVLLRFGQEMNLPGTSSFGSPSAYIAAWRRIRNAFAEIGADNVSLVWCPYVLDRGTHRFEPYYPGHDLVDVVALDGYNWGRRRWWHRYRSFDAIFGASYRALRRLAPDKPIILAELGCAEAGGDKAAWMREAMLHAIPERYPAVEAVVWFDHHRPDHTDWRVDSSPQALVAWRDIVADPRYQLTGAELVDRLSRPRS
jgi:mannan endo-1,4-beta-mannosidase